MTLKSYLKLISERLELSVLLLAGGATLHYADSHATHTPASPYRTLLYSNWSEL